MRAMRRRAIVAVVVAGALGAGSAPARAAEHLSQVEFRTSGSIKVVWHGDRARGCAAAGLCGYSGTTVYPARSGQAFVELEPESFLPVFGALESPGQTRVRTERAVPGGGIAVCSQRSRSVEFTLSADRAWRGRDWLTVDTRIFPQPLASGQCAGPRIEDYASSLPSALVRRRAIKKRGTRVSFRGRFPFKSGPLSGHVVSTLGLKSRGVRHIRLIDGVEDEPRRRGGHELRVELRYEVTRVQGEARNDFRAVTAPICRVRDACGTHGSEVYSLAEAGEKLVVFGSARTHSRRRPSLRRAFRKVARDGYLNGFAGIDRDAGLTAHAFVRPGGATCIDRFRPRQPPVLALFGEKGRLVVTLFQDSRSNILRGRCPGPTDRPNPDIARLRVSPGRLLKRALSLQLHRRRSFRTGAYRGTRTARVNVRLRRTRARVRVDPG
jgi:hypothetical protein